MVDGNRRRAICRDIGITAGRISDIGAISATASARADNRCQRQDLVLPRFIDPHTHYDPQITWEQLLSVRRSTASPSLMGNCGVGVAPCRPADRERISRSRHVESMSQEVSEPASNGMGNLSEHGLRTEERLRDPTARSWCRSAGAHVRNGRAASDRAADKAETEKMAGLLRERWSGCVGLSTTAIPSTWDTMASRCRTPRGRERWRAIRRS